MAADPQLGLRFSGDVCRRKHGGNAHSAAAFARVQPTQLNMAERIRAYIGGCGPAGATLKEVAAQFGKQLNQISGRFSQLKANGQIFDSGRTHEGCAVYVAFKGWVNGREKL